MESLQHIPCPRFIRIRNRIYQTSKIIKIEGIKNYCITTKNSHGIFYDRIYLAPKDVHDKIADRSLVTKINEIYFPAFLRIGSTCIATDSIVCIIMKGASYTIEFETSSNIESMNVDSCLSAETYALLNHFCVRCNYFYNAQHNDMSTTFDGVPESIDMITHTTYAIIAVGIISFLAWAIFK